MPATRALLGTAPRAASPILMEMVIRRFQPVGNLRQRFIEAGATGELLESLLVVTPGDKLENYRVIFVGEEITARIGRDMAGQPFQHLIDFAEMLRPCLDEFRQSIEQNEKIVSRRRYDFSEKWMIEYSRVIYPIIDRAGVTCAVAVYLFHDVELEGRYF